MMDLEKSLQTYTKAKEQILQAGEEIERALLNLHTLLEGHKFYIHMSSSIEGKMWTYSIDISDNRTEIGARESSNTYYRIYIRPKKVRKGGIFKKTIEEQELEIIVSGRAGRYVDDILIKGFFEYCTENFAANSEKVSLLIKSMSSLPAELINYLSKLAEKTTDLTSNVKTNIEAFAKTIGYTSLYQNHPQKFKQIFENLNETQQQEAIQQIIRKGVKNAELDAWLKEKHNKTVVIAGRNNLEGEEK